jgi:hypothetical protein
MDFVVIKVVYKKKAKGKFVPVYAIKTYRGSRNIAPLFLTRALDEYQWSTSRPRWLYPQETS